MLIFSIVALVILFVLNISFGMYYGFGKRHYWFFQMLHFLGGFFVAMFFSNFFRSPSLIFLGLGVITVVWESLEFVIAKVPVLSNYVKRKLKQKNVTPSWGDTIFDIILNFSGAAAFIYLFK